MNRFLAIAGCATVLAVPGALRAGPESWTSVAAESELRFSAYYEGEELFGQFAAFSVELDTDDATGQPIALTVEVNTASADMNDREINAEIAEPEWFDVRAFPLARFECREIRRAAGDYSAAGVLRLKGIERPLEIPLTWQRDGSTAVLSGSIRLSRSDWHIGTGEWANDASLSDRVDVDWRVHLVPAN